MKTKVRATQQSVAEQGSRRFRRQDPEASGDAKGKYANDVVDVVFPTTDDFDLNEVVRIGILQAHVTNRGVKDEHGRAFDYRKIALDGAIFDEDGEQIPKLAVIQLTKAVLDMFEEAGKTADEFELEKPIIAPWAKSAEGGYKTQIRVYLQGSRASGNKLAIRVEPYGTVDSYDANLADRLGAKKRGEDWSPEPIERDAGF